MGGVGLGGVEAGEGVLDQVGVAPDGRLGGELGADRAAGRGCGVPGRRGRDAGSGVQGLEQRPAGVRGDHWLEGVNGQRRPEPDDVGGGDRDRDTRVGQRPGDAEHRLGQRQAVGPPVRGMVIGFGEHRPGSSAPHRGARGCERGCARDRADQSGRDPVLVDVRHEGVDEGVRRGTDPGRGCEKSNETAGDDKGVAGRSSIQRSRQSGCRASSRARPRRSSPLISPRAATRGRRYKKMGACAAAPNRRTTELASRSRSSEADAVLPSHRAAVSTSSRSPASIAPTSRAAASRIEVYWDGSGSSTGGPLASNSPARATSDDRAVRRCSGRRYGRSAVRAVSSRGAWKTNEIGWIGFEVPGRPLLDGNDEANVSVDIKECLLQRV